MTDYKALLKKYMQHVHNSEGSTYVHCINDRTRSDVKFTEEEKAVLEAMKEELYSD